jgi:hypothetical protein
VDINSASETIWENIKISAKKCLCYHEVNKCKPGFEKGWSNYYIKGNKPIYSGYSKYPYETNGDNLNNVRREAKQSFQE